MWNERFNKEFKEESKKETNEKSKNELKKDLFGEEFYEEMEPEKRLEIFQKNISFQETSAALKSILSSKIRLVPLSIFQPLKRRLAQ